MRNTKVAVLVVLLLVLSGCTAINPGMSDLSPTAARNPGERAVAREKQNGPPTLDDLFARIAEQVPGFGGMFIDKAGNLAVYMVNLQPNAATAVQSAIARVFGQDERFQRPIVLLPGKYDFLQLKRWHDRLMPEALGFDSVVSTDIDDANNRLRIGVETLAVQGELELQLNSLGIPREAVIIEQTEPVRYESSLQDFHRPLVGGLQINFGNYLCTLGFIGVRQGVQGFVTNSHCTNTQGGVEGTVYHQPVASGTTNRVGLEIADPTYFSGSPCPRNRRCRYSDSAFVQVPHPSGPAVTVSQGLLALTALGSLAWNGTDAYRIVGEADPLVGETVRKVGRTTGTTQGVVEQTCVNFNVLGTKITQLCQADGSYGSNSGDSGSPVFRVTNSPQANDVVLVGIHWGSGGAFSPIGTNNIQRSTELGPVDTCAAGFSC